MYKERRWWWPPKPNQKNTTTEEFKKNDYFSSVFFALHCGFHHQLSSQVTNYIFFQGDGKGHPKVTTIHKKIWNNPHDFIEK